MVSFQCDVKKPKLDSHRCHCSFTCLDCSTTFFTPAEWKPHSTCITESQKYKKGNGNSKGQSAIAQPQQGPSGTGQYERQLEPTRDVKPNKGRRNREVTGPNVMRPSAGMRVWGSNHVSSEGSPATEVEEPKKQVGKRKLDETEAERVEQPKTKRTRKKSEKQAPPVEHGPLLTDPSSSTATNLTPEHPATVAVAPASTVDTTEVIAAMDADGSTQAEPTKVDGLPVALDGKSPQHKSNKERKAEFKAKLAARSEKEKKSDKQAKKEQKQADKKARRRAKQAEKESSMTPAEKKAAKKKRKDEKAQRQVERKEKEERRIARRLRHYEKKQREEKEAEEAQGAATTITTD
ncbi:hypothetical protein FRB96_004995 [Tulasnella sp. 330]|nr:hypothetical protein FRB96_004995 [Tulasnella sp. 330]KAG8890272.1 hypothetical protein FRB98_000183 [Tulasnella sp. 332]